MRLNTEKKQLIADYIKSSKYPVSTFRLRRRFRTPQRFINAYLYNHENMKHLTDPIRVGNLKQRLNLWTWTNVADKPRMKIQLINTSQMD